MPIYRGVSKLEEDQEDEDGKSSSESSSSGSDDSSSENEKEKEAGWSDTVTIRRFLSKWSPTRTSNKFHELP